MEKSGIKEIIGRLKKKEIRVFDVSEEYENNIQLVIFERKSGLRITGKRGFDIIFNSFFVEEKLIHVETNGKEQKRSVFLSFDSFDSYFDFLNGDIYDNACYTFCPLFDNAIISQKVDLKRLMTKSAFIEKTIDDYSLSLSNEEKESYEEGKQVHKYCQQWSKKFNNCCSYDEFVKVVSNYNKSKIASVVDVSFFFFQYIFADITDMQRFSTIMEYMSTGAYPQHKIIKALCSIYKPDDVLQSFNYSLGAKGTIYKHKKKLKEYICRLKNEEIEFYSKAFFDKKTNYYCEETQGYQKDNNYFHTTIYRYFETFDEFVDYRNGDLTCCDLSDDLECCVDFSDYITDETTILPIHTNTDVTYSIKKYYCNGKFYVTQQWCNKFGGLIKEYRHSFNYFFDFVTFLRGDLSEANLLFCDGLMFLERWNTINFANAKMKSSLCEKFGLKYVIQEIKNDLIKSFDYVEQNENETALVFQMSRNFTEETTRKDISTFDTSFDYKCQRVHYVSDIHLMHRIQDAGCRSKEDIIYVIQKNS